jgi:hypothetical protein
MAEASDAFGLFLSCIEGQPVARFGTKVLIGADRDLTNRRLVRYMPKMIVAIPRAEATKYAREYRRAIADGSVKEQTAAAWLAQQNQLREVGAPRDKLKTATPSEAPAKDPANDHPEGGSLLG